MTTDSGIIFISCDPLYDDEFRNENPSNEVSRGDRVWMQWDDGEIVEGKVVKILSDAMVKLKTDDGTLVTVSADLLKSVEGLTEKEVDKDIEETLDEQDDPDLYGAEDPSDEYMDISEIKKVVNPILKKYGIPTRYVTVKFTRGGYTMAGFFKGNPNTKKSTIGLNKLAWPSFSPEYRYDIILHELSHALDFYLNTIPNLPRDSSERLMWQMGQMSRDPHGEQWLKFAKKIGCSGESHVVGEGHKVMQDIYDDKMEKNRERRKKRIEEMDVSDMEYDDFDIGDKVWWKHKREKHSGKIEKKNRLTARIGNWKVPYNLLHKGR